MSEALTDRRNVLIGMVATTLACASPAMGQANRQIHRKRIPKTEIDLPVIGLGTFMTFDLQPGSSRAHLYDVAKTYWDAGSRIIDTSPLYGMGEINIGDFMMANGNVDGMFVSNKLWTTGDYLADPTESENMLAQSEQRLWRRPIDVMHVHNLVNVEQNLPLLKAWKKEGKIRFHGITHHDTAYYDLIEAILRKEKPDFLQIRYSIATRQAEQEILPIAKGEGIAVASCMPLEKARLHQLVEGRPLPAFAQEFGLRNWADYFLKWVVSHPAIVAAYPATSNPLHAAENVMALQGEMPDTAMRQKMLGHMQSIPGFDQLEASPWYPGKKYPGVIAKAMADRAARLN